MGESGEISRIDAVRPVFITPVPGDHVTIENGSASHACGILVQLDGDKARIRMGDAIMTGTIIRRMVRVDDDGYAGLINAYGSDRLTIGERHV